MIIGLGTAAIGRPQYINIRDNEQAFTNEVEFIEKGIQMIQAAYDRGVRYFDTAPGYGIAERILLEWLAAANNPEVEIASKWGYTYVANFDPSSKTHEVKEHSLAKLREQWNYTKQFLPFLSTYQIHSATFETGVLENEAVLQELYHIKNQNDLIMGITVTGDNQVEVLKRALDIQVNGIRLFEAYQVTFNVLDQSLAAISEMLQSEGVRIIIKEALANGRVFPNASYPHYQNLYSTLLTMASKYDVGIDAIALKYCEQIIDPYKVLSGASNGSHLVANLKVSDFELSNEDLEILNTFGADPKAYWGERKRLVWN